MTSQNLANTIFLVLAIVLALVAALGFGASAVFARIGLQGIKPITGTAISLVASFTMTVVLALSINLSDILALPLLAYAWFLLLGVLNFPLGRLLNFTSVNMIGATRSSPLVSTAPLFSTALAIILLGERPNAFIVLGTIAIIIGSILIVSKGSRGSN